MLETQSTDEEYSKNLEKVDTVPYLLTKELKSNANTPQCIAFKCKSAPHITIDQTEKCIPFTISLFKPNSEKAEVNEENKGSININIMLVAFHTL